MHSSLRYFESCLRTLSSVDENDIHLILKANNSKFITYKIPPGVYTFKELSEVLTKGFKNEFDLKNCNQILNNTKPILLSSKTITLL